MEKTIKLLSRLIEISSVYPDEHRLGEYVKSLFKKTTYRITEQYVEGNRNNVIVEKGKGTKSVLLYSHLDTVPVTGGWKREPLKPYREGDKLFGLGAFDMKAGMAVNIETFLRHEPKNIKLKLVFCVDEEYISKGAHIFAQSPHMDDVVCILSPEPAFAHGENGIVTGRIGRAVIQIKLTRPSTHFYYYEPKNDISFAASQLILHLKKIYKKQGDRKEFVFVRQLHSQSVGMSTPQEVFIELDVSVLAPHTNDDILFMVKKIAEKTLKCHSSINCSIQFKKRETPFLSGYELSKKDLSLEIMKQSIQQITGKKAVPYFRSSVADENIFGSMGKSVLGVGPAGGNAHGADEWVSLSSVKRLQEIYLSFLQKADGRAYNE